ncbi:hypothetical protein ACFOY2_05525 [Nonomuraea purpurea]|uniref:Addiction module protein n=1 Tax=Nonomuraea purpurea TaxID=1849276 RepID=A0ABV8G0D1_9ACTN
MDEADLDELVERGGRTDEEWAALTPEERLQARLDARIAASEPVPPEVRERVRQMYRERMGE